MKTTPSAVLLGYFYCLKYKRFIVSFRHSKVDYKGVCLFTLLFHFRYLNLLLLYIKGIL